MSSKKFIFWTDQKTKMATRTLIGWDIFDFSSETTEWNSTILDRKQDLKILYQVCVFLGRSEKQDGHPTSDWLRFFRLLLWNRWIERNLIGSKNSTSSTKFVISFGRSENHDGRPRFWLAKIFFTFPLKPQNRILRNLTGKIGTSSTKFVSFWLIRKQRWPPWPICQQRWHIVLRCTIQCMWPFGPLVLYAHVLVIIVELYWIMQGGA